MKTTKATGLRLGGLLLVGLLAWGGRALPAAEGPPNILVILTDDQTFNTIHALGNSHIQTPAIDRLVERGTVFTHCYNMGGWDGAICVASRTMLMTGRTIWHAQALVPQLEAELAAGRLWPQILKSHGYRTFMTGKWHVNAPVNSVFDRVVDPRPGMPQQLPQGYRRPVEGEKDTWSPSDRSLGGYWEGGRHWSEVVADDAVAYLQEPSATGQPFFMFVAFNAPHDPRQSPASFQEMYPAAQMPVPDNFLSEYPYRKQIGLGDDQRDESLAPLPRTEHAIQVHRAEYYAIISHLDQQVGRILEALEQTGQQQNTWIIFTADHGLAMGEHGLLGKQNLYDCSLRVPLILVGPGAPTGQRIDDPVYMQDIVPTTIELAGAATPDFIEFPSLTAKLGAASPAAATPPIYAAYLDLQRAIIDGDYKLILYPQAHVARLFHLPSDPDEMHDLFGKDESLPIARRLFQTLLQEQAKLDDTLDLKTAFPDLASG